MKCVTFDTIINKCFLLYAIYHGDRVYPDPTSIQIYLEFDLFFTWFL